MQQTIYKCDQCKKEIGKKVHISLVLATSQPGCGIAIPPSENETEKFLKGFSANKWTLKRFDRQFVHFCNEEHLAKYFKAKMDEAI